MIKDNYKIIEDAVSEAEFVLVGIGAEFACGTETEAGTDTGGKEDISADKANESGNIQNSQNDKKEKILRAYDNLQYLVQNKPYFIVTSNEDDLIFSSKLMDFFIAAPYGAKQREEIGEKQWNSYLNWLAATLGHRLCILELGVGFENPQLIRWPFEKTAAFNFKASFIRINQSFPQLSEELKEKGISVGENAVELLDITISDDETVK